MTKNRKRGEILIGVGGNLPHPAHGPQPAPCEAALDALSARGVRLLARSPWYVTAPVPASDQPDYVNGVARISWKGDADALLGLLHEVEAALGRVRSRANAARIVDLDLLDFAGRITAPGAAGAILPHPRMAGRAFVLVPLRDIAPSWRHPATGEGVDELIARLPGDQAIRRLGPVPTR